MSVHRVLVCGGRDYVDRHSVYACLDGLVPRPTLIIAGGANGADALAADWAGYRNVLKLIFLGLNPGRPYFWSRVYRGVSDDVSPREGCVATEEKPAASWARRLFGLPA